MKTKLIFAISLTLFLGTLIHFYSNVAHLIHLTLLLIFVISLLFIKNDRYLLFFRKANRVLVPITAIWLICVILWEIIFTCTAFGKYDVPQIDTSRTWPKGNTLVLVPHPDDEQLIAGGILDELNKTSQVYVCFSTDGRHPFRTTEAIRALSHYNIPRERILFLGFPDSGRTPGKHMYNHPHTAEIKGTHQRSTTYEWAYKPNMQYTRQNFVDNLISLIFQIKPDTILCIDFDSHCDHRALSLCLEESLCEVFKKDNSYAPTVLKSFAYSPIWHYKPNFYSDNIQSTKTPYNCGYMREVSCYDWKNRIRIPVGNMSLTRTLTGNLAREAFIEHQSQNQNSTNEAKVPKGDKIFWWRPTGNLLINAVTSGTGTNISHLNDFKLYDCSDIKAHQALPITHGWLPQQDNDEVKFALPEPSIIQEIWLYDQLDIQNQVNKLTITLSNGKLIHVEQLPANGAPFVVKTGCDELLNGFTLQVDKKTGYNAGLAEVEAYFPPPTLSINIVKLQDKQDNFMYDYIVPEDGRLDFSIYSSIQEEFRVFFAESTNSPKIQIHKEELQEYYTIQLPMGANSIIYVKDQTDRIVDAVRVRNPHISQRFMYKCLQRLDSFMRCRTLTHQYRFLRFLSDATMDAINIYVRS